jgi:hypothetical protein
VLAPGARANPDALLAALDEALALLADGLPL